MHPMKRSMRVGLQIAAACVGALTLTLALEFGDPGWFGQLSRWVRPAPPQVAAKPLARRGAPGIPITVTPPRPLGTDSSVSPVPQPLLLVRTEVGRNNHEGFAQIGVNAQSPQTYAAGALLANGARLTEIYDQYVVLERDGRSARLYVTGQPANERTRPQSATAGLLMVGGTPTGAPAPVTSQEQLTDYLRPSPVFVDGQVHGYALFAGHNTQAFSQLGLEPGDVITQINGAPVSASSNALDMLKTLPEGQALAVTIERQGVAQTLSLDGAVLKESPNLPLIAPDFSRRPTVL